MAISLLFVALFGMVTMFSTSTPYWLLLSVNRSQTS